MKGICYLIQEPTTVGGKPLNVSGLLEYGRELKTLVPRDVQVMTSDAADRLVTQLTADLATFHPDTDFIVATGDPAIIGIACAIVVDDHGWFKMLKWDKQERRYYPVEVVVWTEA